MFDFGDDTTKDENEPEIDPELEGKAIGFIPTAILNDKEHVSTFLFNIDQQINDYIDHFNYGREIMTKRENAIDE